MCMSKASKRGTSLQVRLCQSTWHTSFISSSTQHNTQHNTASGSCYLCRHQLVWQPRASGTSQQAKIKGCALVAGPASEDAHVMLHADASCIWHLVPAVGGCAARQAGQALLGGLLCWFNTAGGCSSFCLCSYVTL
jgi:hypothetical protein